MTVTVTKPLWTQDQAIAYESALEAIYEVLSGLSHRLWVERNSPTKSEARVSSLKRQISNIKWLAKRLDVKDSNKVTRVLRRYGALARARRV